MADFKKNLEKLARDAKLYWRGFRAPFDLFGKHMLLYCALRVAFIIFFRTESDKKNLDNFRFYSKVFGRGFRASVKTYGKYAFWAVAIRVALFVFFRKK